MAHIIGIARVTKDKSYKGIYRDSPPGLYRLLWREDGTIEYIKYTEEAEKRLDPLLKREII